MLQETVCCAACSLHEHCVETTVKLHGDSETFNCFGACENGDTDRSDPFSMLPCEPTKGGGCKRWPMSSLGFRLSWMICLTEKKEMTLQPFSGDLESFQILQPINCSAFWYRASRASVLLSCNFCKGWNVQPFNMERLRDPLFCTIPKVLR